LNTVYVLFETHYILLDPIEDHLLEPPYKILKPTGLVGALGLVKSKGAGRLHSQALHADTIRE
jgi:hypothetical protein